MLATNRGASKKIIMRAAVPIAMLAMAAGCAPTFEARVARFSALPAPAQQTFTIESRDPQKSGGLEFATYSNLVRQRLTGVGYAEASSPSDASLTVLLDYNVGPPREHVETRYTGFGGIGYGGLGYGGWGYGGRGFGRWGYGGFGWDPYWGGFGYGSSFGFPEVYSVTQYNAQLAMKIVRTSDKASVFEGRAETVSDTNNLTKLVPNLVTAIFTNFPGNSGETVSVRFDPSQPGKPATIKPVR